MPTWFTSAVQRAQQGAAAGAALGALFGGVGAMPGAIGGAVVWAGIGAVADWEDGRVLTRMNAAVPGAEVEAVVPGDAMAS